MANRIRDTRVSIGLGHSILPQSILPHARKVFPFPYLPRPAIDFQADWGLGLNDLDPVGTWNGPNGESATQGTVASKPQFRATDGPGGRPCIRFDGGDFLTLGTSIAGQQYTIFAVVFLFDSNPRTIVSGAGSSFQYRCNALKQNCLKAGVADMGSSTTNLSTSAFQSIAVTYDNATLRFYLSGAADGTASSAQTFSTNITRIGATGGSAEFWRQDLSMVKLYQCVLNPSQIALEFANILARWGV